METQELQRIIFGTESYMIGNKVRIKNKPRNWAKQPYMAIIAGAQEKYDFRRIFRERALGRTTNGIPFVEWNLPLAGGLVELGWFARDNGQAECSTIFLVYDCQSHQWEEVSKEQAKTIARYMDLENCNNHDGEI